MTSRKIFLIVSALLAVSLLLAACGTSETPTAAPEQPTEAAMEEPTEAAAEEPTEEVAAEPTEEEGPAPAAEGKWCSGTDIIFFPGGSPGGPFATVVYNGAVAAEADLGPNVEYVWSDWNPENMVNQLNEAIATNPDGIAIMGHPGDDAYAPLVDEAEAAGIIVTSQNVTLPTLETKYGSNGFGYVGPEGYSAGRALGALALTRSGLTAGDKAFVWGLLAQAGRGERTRGVVDVLEEAGIEVVYQEIDDSTNADAAAGTPVFVGIMSANPDIKLNCHRSRCPDRYPRDLPDLCWSWSR